MARTERAPGRCGNGPVDGRNPVPLPREVAPDMDPFTLPPDLLAAPVAGTNLGDAATFRAALGPRPNVVLFVRHFG